MRAASSAACADQTVLLAPGAQVKLRLVPGVKDGIEYFTLAKGERGAVSGPHGWESDLFSGLTLAQSASADAASR